MGSLVSLIASMFSNAGRAALTGATQTRQAMVRSATVIRQGMTRMTRSVQMHQQQTPQQRTRAAQQMPGLTASQKIAMMGQSPAQIATANAQTQSQQYQQARANTPTPGAVAVQTATELFHALGPLTFGLTTLGATTLAVNLGLKHFIESLIENRREMGQFNGRIAGAYARLDFQKFKLDMSEANQTSGSTQLMVNELMQLRKDIQPFKVMITTLTNVYAVAVMRYIEALLKGMMLMPGIGEKIAEIAGTLEEIEKDLKSKTDAGNTLDLKFMTDLASGRWATDARLPTLK